MAIGRAARPARLCPAEISGTANAAGVCIQLPSESKVLGGSGLDNKNSGLESTAGAKGMHMLYEFCQWLNNSLVGMSVHNSEWQFPALETVHLFGLILLVGSTLILDLRLLGVAFKESGVSKLAHRCLPWTWVGFGIQVATGFLLFSSEAVRMYGNIAFQLKMLMIALAGVNALVFQVVAYKSVGKWEHDRVAPLSARFAGTFSILLWFGIVAAGRLIAYV